SAPVLGIGLQPRPQVGGLALESLDPYRFLGPEVGLAAAGVVPAVPLQHGPGGGFELGGLPLEIRAGPAPGLAGIAWELDAVDGEHLASDQALPVAQVEDVGEDPRNLVAEASDKGGNRRKVRRVITGQRHECDVLATGPLDGAAADDAARV